MKTIKIINLTQHGSTTDQLSAGVIEPTNKKEVQKLLSFEKIPSKKEMELRALLLTKIAMQYDHAMIGGAPFFMSTLEKMLSENGVKPLYAFSERNVVEEPLGDGSTKKSVIFRHLGFVEVE